MATLVDFLIIEMLTKFVSKKYCCMSGDFEQYFFLCLIFMVDYK